jgi:hypothetical protein
VGWRAVHDILSGTALIRFMESEFEWETKGGRYSIRHMKDWSRKFRTASARMIRWLREPNSRWIRLPIGALFIVASAFWFLPVIGIEFLPIGLLLIAEDVPFLRKPAGLLLIWLERKWVALKQ